MRIKSFFVSLALMTLFGTAANAWEKPARATSLEVGKYYTIYNSCANGGYGKFYLYDNGSSLDVTLAATPAVFTELERKHIWKLEEGTEAGTYALYNLATQTYVNAAGQTANAEKQNLTIQDASVYTAARGGEVMNEDGSNAGDANNYKTNDLFFITGAGVTDKNWTSEHTNGGFRSNTNGAQAHAFYEVTEADIAALPNPLWLALTAALDEAKAIQACTGVGAVDATAEQKQAFATAVSKAESFTDATVTEQAVQDLQSAINTYKSLPMLLPEDGKAYKFIAKYSNDTYQTLYWNGTKVTLSADAAVATDAAAAFVCRVVGDKFVFVNNAGKYLSWFSDQKGIAPNCGGTDSYSTDANAYNDLVITRATVDKRGGSVDAAATNASLFGYVHIQGKNTDGNDWYLAARSDGDFIAAGSTDKWYDYDGGWSHEYRSVVYKIEEADYDNTPELKAAANIDGVDAIATWSAPFATVLPADVKAYTVGGDNGTYVSLTELQGEAIPANTGVLLTGVAGEVTMLPATTETAATVGTNLLGNSAGAEKDITGKHVLTAVEGKVAFYPVSASNATLPMNKAYLNLSSSEAREISFDFTTAIQGVETKQANSLKTYDLSGRQVKATRQGLYIRGGKKVIVK